MRQFKLIGGALILAIFSWFVVTNAQEIISNIRLTPGEIENIKPLSGGSGTSGVTGIQTRILKGDPNQPGLYTIQLTVPAHTRIQAHSHKDDRVATVISGLWSIGFGTKFDEQKLKVLPAGSFYTEPNNEAHFAQTGDRPVTVQITGYGPTDTIYIEDKGAKKDE